MKTGGYNSSVLLPGTKYIRYYLLLKAFRRGSSIWFQWGLTFILRSSWTMHHSTGRSTICQGDPATERLFPDETTRGSWLLECQEWITWPIWSLTFFLFLFFFLTSSGFFSFNFCVYSVRLPKSHSSSLWYIPPVGGSDINLFPCECQSPSPLLLGFIHGGWAC